MEKLKDYFKRYPTSQEVYENGGQLFHNRGAADSYGKGETKKYTRKEVTASDAGVKPETKEAVILKIKETEDLTSLPYDELKVWAKILELKPESNSKENVLKALSEFKETLKAE